MPPLPEDIAGTLGLDAASRRTRGIRRWAVAGVLTGAALTAAWYLFFSGGDGDSPKYVTALAERGTLEVRVTATGTLEPINDVEISSELSGIVRRVLVDYNDRVSAGQVLAELDTDKLEAQMAHDRATLAAAQAHAKEAEATLAQAAQDLKRYGQLVETKAVSVQKYQEATATHDRAAAVLDSTRADVAIAEAQLRQSEINLTKASIRSPVDGVVLQRSVNPGQTVAATLQAPVLFTVAESLSTMELQVDVDEADVGLVEVGQTATFTVDAYPGRGFSAAVTKVRFAPKATAGVVTYTTHLSVDNRELLLRPGMTATAEISVRTVADALLIPSEALRFEPPAAQATEPAGSLLSRILPRPPVRATAPPRNDDGDGNERRVWALRNGAAVEVPVATGLSDGQMTEIVGGELQPGDAVIVDSEEGA